MWLFYLLILVTVMPYHHVFAKTYGPFSITKFTGMATLFWAVLSYPVRGSSFTFGINGTTFLFLVYYLVQMVSCALRGTVTLAPGDFTKLLAILMLAVITRLMIDSQKVMWRAMLVLTGAIALSSTYVIRQYLAYSSVYRGFRTWGGPSGDPNYFALMVAMWLPVGVMCFLRTRKKLERLYLAGCLAASTLGFLFVASRGGLLAVLAGVALLALRSRRKIPVIAAGLLVLALVLMSPVSPMHRLMNPSHADAYAAESRVTLWRTAIRIFLDHPFFGIGSSDFLKHMQQYQAPHERLPYSAVHNTYFECAAMYGLAGTVPFLLLLISVFWNLGRVAKEARTAAEGGLEPIARGMQAGLAAYAIGAIFLSTWWHMVIWLFVFLSMSLVRIHDAGRARNETEFKTPAMSVGMPRTAEARPMALRAAGSFHQSGISARGFDQRAGRHVERG